MSDYDAWFIDKYLLRSDFISATVEARNQPTGETMDHPEHEAFESADRSSTEAAMPAMEVIRKMARLQPNERTCAFLINEIRYMVDNCNWKHTEHAKSVSDLLSSAVFILENASDEKLREHM